MNKKKKIFVDTFYFKAAPAGIKTYIKELVASSKKSNSSKYIYIYSHDIKKLENNLSYLNSSLKINRWIFQLNYFFWKQFILPIRDYYWSYLGMVVSATMFCRFGNCLLKK